MFDIKSMYQSILNAYHPKSAKLRLYNEQSIFCHFAYVENTARDTLVVSLNCKDNKIYIYFKDNVIHSIHRIVQDIQIPNLQVDNDLYYYDVANKRPDELIYLFSNILKKFDDYLYSINLCTIVGTFKQVSDSKLLNVYNNRLNSVSEYVQYLADFANFGKIDEIYMALKVSDSKYIRDNIKLFSKESVYNSIVSLIEKIDSNEYYGIQTLIIDKEQRSGISVPHLFGLYFQEVWQKIASHEQNFILSYLLNMVLKGRDLDADNCREIIEYFWRAKNCNPYRKDYCIFSVVDYAIKNNLIDMFVLKQQWYDHIHKIYNRIYHSPLLNTEQKNIYTKIISTQIKKVNLLRSNPVPKVAVCISGLYRNHAQVLDSIYKNIVVPLNADVFVHTWDQMSVWTGVGGNSHFTRVFGEGVSRIIPPEIFDLNKMNDFLPNIYKHLKEPIFTHLNEDIFQKVLFPKKMLIEDQNVFEESLGDISGYTKARGSLNQIKMLHGIKKTFDMALQYDDYDCILRVRPDTYIRDAITYEKLDLFQNNVIYTNVDECGLQDMTFIISSSMAYNFSHFVKRIFDIKQISPYDSFPLFDSHNLFLAWMIENNYTFGENFIKSKLLDMSDTIVSIPNLKAAIESDVANLNLSLNGHFLPFIKFLQEKYC